MLNRNKLAMAIAVASAGAVAQAATVSVPNPEVYTAEAAATSNTMEIATAAVTLTTTPVLQMSTSDILTLAYSSDLEDFSGAALGTAADLVINIKDSVGTFATNGIYSIYATNGTMAGVVTATGIQYLFNSADDLPKLATAYRTLGLSAQAAFTTPTAYVGTGTSSTSVTATYARPSASDSGTGTVQSTIGSQAAGGALTGGATIDVNALKQSFINSASSTSLVLNFDKDSTTTSPNIAATNGSVAITITGQDFGWLDSDLTTAGVQLGGNVTANKATVTTTINEAEDTLTAVLTGTAANQAARAESITLTLNNSEENVIDVNTSISASARIFYGAAAPLKTSVSVPLTGTASFILNGSSVDVYAVPVTADVFLWMTNTGTGTTPENVTVSIFDGSSTAACVLEDVAQTTPGVELDLTAAINNNIATACPTYVESGNRVRYNITTNAPATDIRVSGVYRVGTDRVNLLTSSETQ